MEPEFNRTGPGPSLPDPTRGDIAGHTSEPPRRGSHRRAHSDTFFRLPPPGPADDDDDPILFDAPDFDFSIHSLTVSDDPDSSSALPAASDDSNDVFPAAAPDGPKPPFSHLRSFSMDEVFFDGLNLQPPSGAGGKAGPERRGHRHSSSMDGFLSSSLEADSSSSFDYAKKAMAPEKLAELALMDPKRAKRILANRQSAARSKERKIRYTSELERKVQTLQTEATTLSAQLTLLQRDTNDLNSENKELKLRLQAMEQQAHLQDALSEALRDEVQRLKIATGQVPQANSSFNRGLQPSIPQFFSPSPMLHQMGSRQSQQHVTQASPNAQPRNGQSQNTSVDFTRSSFKLH